MRRLVLTGVLLLVLAGDARAATPVPFGDHPCVRDEAVRICRGDFMRPVASFDGTPLDVDVTLPGEGDGPFPLVILLHGYGGEKFGLDGSPGFPGSRVFAEAGFAVLHATARGFFGSCGLPEARAFNAAGCARGWQRIDDVRYEVRDAQHLAGLLVDQGLADPRRIGATGDSYGGAPSIFLALLRDRVVGTDDRLMPWRSPAGTPLRVAAAAPVQTWGDLVEGLVPNGRALDYDVPPAGQTSTPPGVLKQTLLTGFLAAGQVNPVVGPIGYLTPPGVDVDSDLTSWVARLSAGEPYAGNAQVQDILDELRAHHSPLTWLDATEPAPLLLASGWADDLFGVMQSLRLRNAIQARHPQATVALELADVGHQRSAQKPEDAKRRQDRLLGWLVHHVAGRGPAPYAGIQAAAMTCGADASSGPVVRSQTWAALHPGELVLGPGAGEVAGGPGDLGVGRAIDPVLAGSEHCATTASDDLAGAVTLRSAKAIGDGFTLLGSPTVEAVVTPSGPEQTLAARVWDVAPDGRQVLVSRGIFRLDRAGPIRFQIATSAWRFAPGHVAKVELLASDAPYLRAANDTGAITVREVFVRLPTRERSDNAIVPASPLPLPAGAVRAPDRAAPNRRVGVRTRCRPDGARTVTVTGALLESVRLGRGRRDAVRPFVIRTRRVGKGRLEIRRADGRTVVREVRLRRCR